MQPVDNAVKRSDTPSSLVFYNDNDAYCAQWLRNLGDAGLLPVGFVDERSILDIKPSDLAGYEQCHFFAGIGGWPLALQLAGWRGPVWTGSCPCQPLSSAGLGRGHADERHLWPAFYALIAEFCPATIFGEQVASKDGREWFAGVRADLEHLGYVIGAADLPAASVGAPHIRQRLFWVADSGQQRRQQVGRGAPSHEGANGWQSNRDHVLASYGAACGLANASGIRRDTRAICECSESAQERSRYADADCGWLGNADDPRSQGWRERPLEYADQRASWATGEFIRCLDGRARRAEPSIHPLAHGIPSRVGRLRAYGNAIVPPLAAEFVSAWMETNE